MVVHAVPHWEKEMVEHSFEEEEEFYDVPLTVKEVIEDEMTPEQVQWWRWYVKVQRRRAASAALFWFIVLAVVLTHTFERMFVTAVLALPTVIISGVVWLLSFREYCKQMWQVW